MAEFKINSNISGEISSLRSSGNSLNSDYAGISSRGVSSLKTAMSIIEQHREIKEIIELYKALVLRDSNDLDELVAAARETDALIGEAIKSKD